MENNYTLPEGDRNNALFSLALQLCSISQSTDRENWVLRAVHLVNENFSQEPLPATEIVSIVRSAMKRVEEFPVEKFDRATLFFQMLEDLKGHIFCTTNPTQWYEWSDGYWQEVKPVVIEHKVMQKIISVNPMKLKNSMIAEVMALLQKALAYQGHDSESSEFSILGKVNFRNGVLDICTMKLLEPSPNFRFFSQLPVDYDPGALPDKTLQQILLDLTDGNRTILELVRGLIRRAIEPAPDLQTGFWIYGPPGTGKSTFLNWLQGVVGHTSIEMVVRNMSLFTNARLKDKSLIVISDGESLHPEAVRLCKTILGRDTIAFDWKHETVALNTFVSSAVLVVTSNQGLANSTLSAYDEGFVDRMIEIPFTFVPARPQAGLSQLLDNNTAALINWAFGTSKEFLQSQVYAGMWSYSTFENNLYIDFIRTCLVEKKGGFISNANLLERLDEFLKENGQPPLPAGARKRAPNIIFVLISRAFACFARKGREKGKGVRGIVGLAAREGEYREDLVPRLKDSIRLVCKDPFEMHPITPYEELSEGRFAR